MSTFYLLKSYKISWVRNPFFFFSGMSLHIMQKAIDSYYASHRGYWADTVEIDMNNLFLPFPNGQRKLESLQDVKDYHELLLALLGYGLNSMFRASHKPMFRLVSDRVCACGKRMFVRLQWSNTKGKMAIHNMSYYCADCRLESDKMFTKRDQQSKCRHACYPMRFRR